MRKFIFLPGLNNDSQVWNGTREKLSTRVESIALDLPPKDNIDEIVEYVGQYLEKGTVLVGHSFGGVVAMRIAELHEELIDGLVLVNAPITADAPDQVEARLARAAAVRESGYEELAMGNLHRVFAGTRGQDPAVQEERLRGARAYGPERFYAHTKAIAGRLDRSNFLKETKVPVLVVASDDDLVVLTAEQRAWAEDSTAQYVEIADAGHMLPAEQPADLAAAINDWWRSTEAGKGYLPVALPEGPLPDYVIHGEGETTLFLMHGAYGNRDYFDDAINRWVGEGLRVVAWNCPGYGVNEEVPEGYGVPLLAEYGARMILKEQTKHNVLLGHSMGGLIGPRVPALVGDVLDGLILSGASAGFTNRTPEDKERYLDERVKPITEGGLSVSEYAVGLLKVMMAPGAAGPLVDRVVEVVEGMKTDSFVASMGAIVEYNSVPSLQALKIPTLMLAGESDTACPPAGMKKMQELVAGSDYYEVKNAGHYAFAEQADTYQAVTVNFINKAVSAA